MSSVLRRLIPSRPDPSGAEMSFTDHLEELRSVLFACLLTLVILGVGGWFVSDRVMDFLIEFAGLEGAQAIKPQEIFFTRFKISIMIGLLVGMPYIAAQIWGFVVPGLLQRERKTVFPLVFWSTLLFLSGVAFSLLVLTPIMLKFLAGFETLVVTANLAVGYVLDFYLRMAIACGFLFQLPLVVAVLSLFGILSPRHLRKFWRHAVVIILIAAAVVTPADVLSQLALGTPIILLYFVSILVSAVIQRGRRRKEPEQDEETPEEGPPEDGPDGGSEDGPDGGSEGGPAGGSEDGPDGGSEGGPAGGSEDGPDDDDQGGPGSGDGRRATGVERHEGGDAEGSGTVPGEEIGSRPDPVEELKRLEEEARRRRDLHPPDQDYSI